MNKKAFTLIELLVVISIIALLSSVVLASLNSARTKGSIAAGKSFDSGVYHEAADYAAGVWDMGDCSGGTAADTSGNNMTGTLQGSPTWQTDTPFATGCSLLLNGSTQYVSAGHVQDGVVNFTWTAWIKTTQIASHASAWGHPAIMGTIQASGATNDAMLMVQNGYIAWYDELNGGSVAYTSTQFVSDGVWHHVAVSRSGTSLRFFVDGKLIGTATTGTNPLNSNGLEIGRAIWSNSMLLAGNITHVRAYSKDLTASEIGKLYAAEAPHYQVALK